MSRENPHLVAVVAIAEALPGDLCLELEALALSAQRRAAVDGARPTDRRSAVLWPEQGAHAALGARARSALLALLPHVQPVYDIVVDGLEPLQLARYGVGDGYDTHIDLGPGASSRRKLSVTVQLSDGATYEGGALAFQGEPSPRRERGTALFFPAFLPHTVRPVRAGVRCALTGWFTGPPFR